MTDWFETSASDLGRAIADGRADPVDLATSFLDAAEAHPHGTRIYCRLTRDRALAEAEAAAARARAGLRRGLLDGVPISWKDLFDTAGVVTEAGSRLLEGRVPVADAEVLARATRAGLVCLGKTQMSELAFSGLGLNPVWGKGNTPEAATPPNINDPAGVPGGSSSGAATSVAFGLAAAAIGSDTGGSVRVPAAYNDLVGLKTTEGRLSLQGVVPLAERFDTVGPLCRSVEDCAELLAVLEGSPAADLRGATLAGKRFLILEPYSSDVREVPSHAFASAIDRMGRAGAQFETASVDGITEAMDLSGVVFSGEAYGTWKTEIEAAPDKMFPRILDRFRSGAAFSAPDYVAAWRRLADLRRDWLRQTAAYDGVILPTAANLPADIARLMSDPEYYVTENLLTLRNTRVGNLMGLCGLSLPTGTPSAGIMLLCPPMAEERLLRLGSAIERALA